MSEFKREDRYIVIKRSDLKKVPIAYRSHLVDPMLSLLSHLPHRECLVIESDWPEYNFAWLMIEHRMGGHPVPDFNAVKCAADVAVVESQLAALREELAKLKGVTNFSDAVACVFDYLKIAAANTDSREWDDQLEELAQDVIEFAPEYKKQWKDICSLDKRLADAERRNESVDIEAAAQKLAACMDYPWEYMPEQGRASMREHAKAVIDAALTKPEEAKS